MRCMFIYESLCRVAEEKLRYDEQSDVFFAVEGLLKDVTSVTVDSELNDTATTEKDK